MAGPSGPIHIPVLYQEVLEGLRIKPSGCYIDGTLGGGGHAMGILKESSPAGRLLGIDADPEAIKVTRQNLRPYSDSILLLNDNFANLKAI